MGITLAKAICTLFILIKQSSLLEIEEAGVQCGGPCISDARQHCNTPKNLVNLHCATYVDSIFRCYLLLHNLITVKISSLRQLELCPSPAILQLNMPLFPTHFQFEPRRLFV
uniref:Secreted protein n=1 Tax=Glossina pallidipes TaxID=7398 RepID=A0A1A9ZKF6_GLOPL